MEFTYLNISMYINCCMQKKKKFSFLIDVDVDMNMYGSEIATEIWYRESLTYEATSVERCGAHMCCFTSIIPLMATHGLPLLLVGRTLLHAPQEWHK